MAWPLTPIQTFIANVTRWSASFANQLQSGVNGIVAATYSLVGVVVDGTGGATVTPEAGTVKVSKSASGTAQPTSASFSKGTTYKESNVLAFARVLGNGAGAPTLVFGQNISSVTRNAQGDYVVTLITAASDSSHIMAVPALSSPTNHTLGGVTANAGNYAAGSFHVYVTSSSSGALDLNGDEFTVTVYGA